MLGVSDDSCSVLKQEECLETIEGEVGWVSMWFLILYVYTCIHKRPVVKGNLFSYILNRISVIGIRVNCVSIHYTIHTSEGTKLRYTRHLLYVL